MSATQSGSTTSCHDVHEALAQVLDGTASAVLYDHIANCDTCRDLRHEAGVAAELVAQAGGDFVPPRDFVPRLLERIEKARPAAPVEPARAPEPAEPQKAGGHEMPKDTPARGSHTTDEPSAAKTEIASAKTELAPFSGDAATPSATEPDRPATSKPDSEHRFKTGGATAAVTQPGVEPVQSRLPATRSSSTQPSAGVGAAPAPAAPAPAAPAPAAPAPAAPAPAAPAARKPQGKVIPLFRRRSFLIGVTGSLAAAAAVGLFLKSSLSTPDSPVSSQQPWSATVASVARASADKTGGLEACDTAGACAPIAQGAAVQAGTTLRTDARTRAYLKLDDGTLLAIDRASEIELGKQGSRWARVSAGTIVADVTPSKADKPARIVFPQGKVDILGTKLALTVGRDRAAVEVARGSVRVTSSQGNADPTEVRAGEEAALRADGRIVVSSSTSLADVMEWSDRTPEEVDSPVLRGLGELRARKPGQTKERDHAVRLAKHSVKVRIVDVMARTEVDETFTNDTNEELEGIFRFPLPPGAQIERLALEVEGKLMEGAFVDRDKGAAIWRGVIQNAAPKAPKPREEIIWVPGPWRDPALLEWQRGGRFELKIFPIPRKGSRRVVLTYTQIVDQAAGVRRFTYPLAHDPSGTTNIDSFDLDLQVLGHDRDFGIQTRGYELAASGGGAAERRTMQASAFIPAGDLTVEYALPDRDREVTAWAYRMDAAAADAGAPVTGPAATKAKTAEEKQAEAAALAIASDASPYVAIAVRPKLPRWQAAKERLHVLVVDSSRSMIGERFARATRLASSIVREMDRRDAFVLLACDTVCREMPSSERTPGVAPGAAAAGEVERFLGAIEPDGGSDLAAAMTAARTAAGSLGDKELRIIYLGDGTPTVGPTRASHLETAVRSSIGTGDGAVVACALGSDADMTSLQALARGGGGVVVPYVPGQKVSSAALDALGAAYGVVLREPEIELPAGLTQVTPARLDPIRAGGETFIVARMSTDEIGGTIKLRGRVADERFEQTYPVKILATTNAGNAFVPRLFAAAKIAELEQIGSDVQKPAIVELSRRFSVASRFTSLLVLESEAMMNAFGLERKGIVPTFTGELQADSFSADAEGELPAETVAEGNFNPFGGVAGGGMAATKSSEAKNAEKKPSSAPRLSLDDLGGGSAGPPMATPAPAPTTAPGQFSRPPPPAKVAGDAPARRPPVDSWGRRRRLVAMKRVFDRKASFEAVNSLAQQNAAKLIAAESALAAAPDSRDKTVELYTLLATSGRIGEAQELTAKWSGRDALDPDALMARADLAARQGDRDRAVRILGGLADVRPGDRAVQARLASLQETAGNPALACQHKLALADLAPSEAKLVADAARCARTQGLIDLASLVQSDGTEKVRLAVDKLLAAPPPTAAAPAALTGDIQVTAEWTGGEDIDIALIDRLGRRLSWLGSPSKIVVKARDVTSSRTEGVAFLGMPSGHYVVEVSRTGGQQGNVIRGDVTLRLAGNTRRIPFALTGERTEVGTIRVFFTSRLVPANSSGFGWR